VRSQPGGTRLGVQKKGAFGTVIGGPVKSGSHTWWQLNYDVAPDGWSAEDWLEKPTVAVAPNVSQVLGAVSPASPTSVAEQIRLLQLQIEQLQRQLQALLAD
jgi:hypothetical protein